MIEIGIINGTPVHKIINIRDKKQVIKAMYCIDANDVLKYTLMAEHYIEISFELNRNTSFKRSDYIEWEGDKYTLRQDYQPEQINKRKYKYTLKFEALELFFQDIQYYYLNQGLKESEWRLTGNPEYFIKIGVDNINRYFGDTDFKVGTIEPTEIKDILFDTNTNTFDALTQIAEAYEAEWYMTGKTIHLLNKVSFGDEVDFETEVSVLSMQREEGEINTRYTRIVALGSTRNIPNDYRATTPGEAVDAIYPKRLRIPASKGDVIDAYPNMSPDEVVEGTIIFDEVYPKRVGTIEAVGTIEYQDVNEDTGEKTKWNAYKIKDSGINFKKEYLLPGQELKLQFTSGDLNGRDFALIFHEKGFSSTDNSQFYEIVRTDEFGKALPNDIMKPKVGDKYVLYGFNIALVSDQYVPAGEQELYDVAVVWQKKQLQDTGVYECPTVIKHFVDNQMDLGIGQKVRLVFDDENVSKRSSRIMGFEKKLNNKFDATYTVGDNSTYSRFGKIEDQIKELQIGGIVYEQAGGGSGVYVIKQFDSTRPTDFNVYSALASDAKYFNKQTGGTVQGDTTFAKNMQVQGTAIGDVFQNSTFTAGQLGSGFQIKRDANGMSYGEVDYFTVRREMTVHELTIAEIKSVGGTILLSLADMLVSKVENKGTYWRTYFNTDGATIYNNFVVGDQVICRIYNTEKEKYYWAKVIDVGADYIDISKSDNVGHLYPEIGDSIIQLGHRTDVNRQSAILISAYGSDAPSIKQYAGINSYDLTGKEVTVISPKGNKFTGSFEVSTNGTTAPVYKERGVFVNGTVYYLNDRVSYLGSHWVCIVNTTITTPSETSSTWRKETAGQEDIDNAVNDIQVGGRNLIRNSNFSNGLASWVGYQSSSSIVTDSKFGNVAKVIKIEGASNGGIHTQPVDARVSGNDHIVTVWLKADTPSQISVASEGNPWFGSTLSVTTEWKKYTITGIWKLGTYNSFFMRSFENSYFYIANVKYEVGNKATDWSPAPEDVELAIKQAENKANQAQIDADKANSVIADIANDNKLTPNEKQIIAKDWGDIQKEYPNAISEANKFSVSTTAYTTAYNALNSYITPLLVNLTTTDTIVGTTFRLRFNTYREEYVKLLNAIASKTKALADAAQTTANNAQSIANQAKTDASNAQSAANKAQTDANTANNLLTDIASDNKLTPNEKQETKKEWDVIVSEYPKNIAQANKFGVAPTAYTNAYNALNSYITPLLANLGTTSDINGATFRATFKAYYDARTDLLNAISTKAKELADQAKTAADNAQKEAEKVRTEYKADFVVLDTKIASKVSQTDFNALGQRVSTSESSIIQLSNSITSVVEKVDNIQVGGVNLVSNLSSNWVQGIWISYPSTLHVYPKIISLKEPFAISGNKHKQFTWSDVGDTYLTILELDADKVLLRRRYALERGTHDLLATTRFMVVSLEHKTNNITPAYIVPVKLLIEGGNKATDWTPSIEDVNSGVQNAQDTADSKNRTYYQDAIPLAPSGGHKVGDLWYKTSLVDSSGTINADTSKNIYQLQYRWDSATWQQINWSVSKSKIEQTDSSITSIVEKTGLNSVGAGSSLYSMIQQTPEMIQLEVSKIQVGGRNLIRNSNFSNGLASWVGYQSSSSVVTDSKFGNVAKVIKIEGASNGGIHTLPVDARVSGNDHIVTVWLKADTPSQISVASEGNPWFGSTLSVTTEWKKYTITGIWKLGTHNSFFMRSFENSYFYIANVKYEVGNKATDWSPAPEDVQAGIDNAQSTANAAQTQANNTNALVSDISNDNKLTPNEKQLIKKDWDAILIEVPENVVTASEYGVSATNYILRYNDLKKYIEPLLANLTTTDTIVGVAFRQRFSDYHNELTILTNNITAKAKDKAVEEVKAGLKVEADGVTVFGEKFTVNSLLIAKAIEAESLNIGGNLTIGKDGMLSIAGGKILLRPDGSGQLANGNITWDVAGNVSMQGKFESSYGANKVVIDPATNDVQLYIANKLAGRMYAYIDPSFGTAVAAFESMITISGNEYKTIYSAGLMESLLNGKRSYAISNNGGMMQIFSSRMPSNGVTGTWYVENGIVKVK